MLDVHSKKIKSNNLLDGCIVLLDIDEATLPKMVQLLKKGQPGTTRPRVLVQPNDKVDTEFAASFNNICMSVAKIVMHRFPCIQNCVCYSPHCGSVPWINLQEDLLVMGKFIATQISPQLDTSQ